MNTFTKLAIPIVTIALVFYLIGIITEQRKRKVLNIVLTFLTLGVILDIAGTVFMIIGSGKEGITLHGVIGYSSLTLMFIDTLLLWKFRIQNDKDKQVSKSIHIYSRIAITWWVLGYISGGLLVALR